jgi:hypothetical protein
MPSINKVADNGQQAVTNLRSTSNRTDQTAEKTFIEKVSKFAIETIPTFISDNKYAIGAAICITAGLALGFAFPVFWVILGVALGFGFATLFLTAMQVETWKRGDDERELAPKRIPTNNASPAPKKLQLPSFFGFLDPFINPPNKDSLSDILKTYENKNKTKTRTN